MRGSTAAPCSDSPGNQVKRGGLPRIAGISAQKQRPTPHRLRMRCSIPADRGHQLWEVLIPMNAGNQPLNQETVSNLNRSRSRARLYSFMLIPQTLHRAAVLSCDIWYRASFSPTLVLSHGRQPPFATHLHCPSIPFVPDWILYKCFVAGIFSVYWMPQLGILSYKNTSHGLTFRKNQSHGLSSNNPPIQDSQPLPSLEDMETQEPSDADIPSHTSSPVSAMGSRSSKRKRGKARGIPRPNNEADRLVVRINIGGAVTMNRNKFITKLGVFVKDQKDFPFWQRDYDSFPQSKWDDMARVAREYFNIDYQGNLANLLKKSCRNLWNDARSSLYRNDYEPYNHDEAIQRVPLDMRSDTWIRVCDEIFSQSWWKKTSNINTENRTHQLVVHVSGRTPFTQSTEDLRTQLGRDPKRVELWDCTHIRRDGTFANAHTEAITTQMNERIEQARQTSDNVDEDLIFQEVLGPETRGRVRGLGSGISRRDYFSYHQPLHMEMQTQLDTIQSENEKLKSDYEQVKSDYAQLKSEHEQVISRCEGMVEENVDLRQSFLGLQNKFDSMSQFLHQNSFASMSQQMPYQNYTQMLQGGFWHPPPRPPLTHSADNLQPPNHEGSRFVRADSGDGRIEAN